ncbi:transmembrane protein 272-like isoform X1 [Dermacentor andersoni]|uniref:transmembrane protein 272-like isoform X1 n=2 Tax=Dermacentor andersoni TaxID=34620 RepID=UPI00215577D1|nr:transmembrane protein 272-like isoform X1 [Dermacentor andersoni]
MACGDTRRLCSETEFAMSLPPYSDSPLPTPFRSPVENDLPPSYDDITNPNAPPPSYQSLFGQVREVHKASSGVIDFLRSIILLLLGTLGCTILVGVTVIIPVSMIVIGTTYLNDCPAEKYIPIFLVMGGVFGVLKTLLDVCGKCRRPDNSGEAGHNVAEEQRAEERTWSTLVNCFLFAWYVAGCVWVYRAYPPDYTNSESPAFCDRTLYLFAFGLVTAGLLSLGLVAACLCCLTLFSLLSSKD